MKKKTFITITIFLFVLFFAVSYTFAANELASAAQGVRNVVGGAENMMEDAASGITNGVRNGVSGVQNVAENTTTTMGAMTSDNNYNATRTATTRSITGATTGTFLGMGATAWGWFIMAVVGIVTIALVWYYGKQHELYSNHNNDNY